MCRISIRVIPVIRLRKIQEREYFTAEFANGIYATDVPIPNKSI